MIPDDGTAVRWRPAAVPAEGGRTVPVRVYDPAGSRRGWLVWAHGGSWTAGSVADWHPACADLARAAHCTVVSVEYRLAPRYRHPAALRDVLAALDWAEAQVADEPARTLVGGDSAGGTIAACAALVRRDQGRPLAAQVLAYPPLDPECGAASYTRHGGFPTRAWMLDAWRAYQGSEPDATPYRTPFDAADLSGAPPAVLGVGAWDPAGDDTREYARRLRSAGCSVTLRDFPATGHGGFLSAVPGERLRQWLGDSLRPLLATSDSTRRIP